MFKNEEARKYALNMPRNTDVDVSELGRVLRMDIISAYQNDFKCLSDWAARLSALKNQDEETKKVEMEKLILEIRRKATECVTNTRKHENLLQLVCEPKYGTY